MKLSNTPFSQQELHRYHRQLILPELGHAGQKKLKSARVLVIGAGGLGCPALQYLAAAGVGTLGIVDGDTVSLSNLHRQILFNEKDVGRNKASAAAEKLTGLNPLIRLEVHPFFLEADHAEELIAEYDLVLDGSDNFSTRYLVNDACVLCGKPFIYASLHKFELQLAVFNLHGGPTYRCLYPQPPAPGEMPSCSEAGILGMLPGTAGTLQALEAIKILTGLGKPLSGKLLIMDLLGHERQLLNLQAVPENRSIKKIRKMNVSCPPAADGMQSAAAELIPEIPMNRLRQWIASGDVKLIDVRSPAEFAAFRLDEGETNLPLDVLENMPPQELNTLATSGSPLVLLCQSGIRSQKAGRILKAKNFTGPVFSLQNGLDSVF